MGFSLFKKQSKEVKFWKWFSKNQATYHMELDDLELRDEMLNRLWTELKKVHADLVFQFSIIKENGTREFVISAEGIKSAFSAVERLISQAPNLENWEFIAFRQRTDGEDITIEFGSFSLGYQDIYFDYNDGDYGQLEIQLFVRDFIQDDRQYISAIFILLDNLLGEYDITMGIEHIEWNQLDESKIENLKPIFNLRSIIDQKKN